MPRMGCTAWDALHGMPRMGCPAWDTPHRMPRIGCPAICTFELSLRVHLLNGIAINIKLKGAVNGCVMKSGYLMPDGNA
ncbi:hypothetical protein [Paraglaciecola sp. 25GB23A]|uniref:hypothetical protein n=1 Tax=Paraglaciecola sp. 25GB23A TaxID=3156068 RepID=UPI0032AF4CF2